jgi:hypothetical protein
MITDSRRVIWAAAGWGAARQRDGLSAHPREELHQLAAERTWSRLCVHDEIVVECDTSAAQTARAWLVAAMHAGKAPLLPCVLVEVEAPIGKDWNMEVASGGWR